MRNAAIHESRVVVPVLVIVLMLIVTGCTHGVPDASATNLNDGSVRVHLGDVLIVGEPGSLSPGESVQAHLVSGVDPGLGMPVGAVGTGVDLTVPKGATLNKPLKVTFKAVAPRKGWFPLVAHRGGNGRWDLRQVVWNGTEAVLSTDAAAVIRLVGAVLIDTHDECRRTASA